MKTLWLVTLSLAGAGAVPQQAAPPPTPLSVAPIAYFSDHCARCHGDGGWGYTKGFADKMTDDALLVELKSMAAGQGGSPLEPKDLKVQSAYHRAMSAQGPFLAWTKETGSELSGEVTDATTVSATANGKTIAVTVKDGSWHLRLPSGTKEYQVVLEAIANKKKARLDLSKEAFSNLVKSK